MCAVRYVDDVLRRWTAYWPIELGKLIFYNENYPLVKTLQTCLAAAAEGCPAFQTEYATIDMFSGLGRAFTPRTGSSSEQNRWYGYQMNLWKFDADRISSADVIAFVDDDSCMQDYVLPSEIVNAQGKLVAKGVRIKPFPGFIYDHINSNKAVGLGWHAYYMIDFPV